MNKAAGLQILANGVQQQDSAPSPTRSVGQNARSAEGLPGFSHWGSPSTPVSFRSVLTAEELSTLEFKTTDAGVRQSEMDSGQTRTADKAEAKSKSSAVWSYIRAGVKSPPAEKKTSILPTESVSSIMPAPFPLPQPPTPVKTTAGHAESHAKGPLAEGSSIAQKGQELNRNANIGNENVDSQGPKAFTSPPTHGSGVPSQVASVERAEGSGRTLNSASGNAERGGRDSLSVGTTKSDAIGVNSLNTAVGVTRGGNVGSTMASAPAIEQQVTASVATVERSPTHPEANTFESSSFSNLGQLPAHRTGGFESTPNASNRLALRPATRSAPNFSAQRSTVSEAGSSQHGGEQEAINPVPPAAVPGQSSPVSTSGSHASKLVSADGSASNDAASAAGRTTSARLDGDMASHTSANQHSAASQQSAGSNFARDLSGVPGFSRGSQTTATDSSSSGSTPTKLNPQETFAALDAESRAATPISILSAANMAEAGFKDPTLGWVGVRAQSDGSGVHATLVPGSADASQALSASLPNLGAYLSEQGTPVHTLTMALPEGHWETKGGQPQGGMEAGQGNGNQGQSGQQRETRNGWPPSGDGPRSKSGGPEIGVSLPPIHAVAESSYISVIV